MTAADSVGDVISWRDARWAVRVCPHDGARLTRLQADGVDLLTPPPPTFQPPHQDYGDYETRAVYGGDACFPSVDACALPSVTTQKTEKLRSPQINAVPQEKDAVPQVPDHGELYDREWRVREMADGLDMNVTARLVPARIQRRLIFSGPRLTWQYRLTHQGGEPFPFLYVMHALMPIVAVNVLELPNCGQVVEEKTDSPPSALSRGGDAVCDYLRLLPSGRAVMLLLRRVETGCIRLCLERKVTLKILFDPVLFSTLGIWWNNGGYPDEDGLRRLECAFEPIPGSSSSLAAAYADGSCPILHAGETMEWQVVWEIEKKAS